MGIIRKAIKKILKPFLKTWLDYYYKKTRKFHYKGIVVEVAPSVFPPQLTLSTKILLNFVAGIDLRNKTLLELGCGSGIISLFASKKEAKVTASDINTKALENLRRASVANDLPLQVIYSDLFDQIGDREFDFILINPPYYPEDPNDIKERAWYCGKEFQYFKELFSQLPKYLTNENRTYLILSEDCAIETISGIAHEFAIHLEEVRRIKKWSELNYIYRVKR